MTLEDFQALRRHPMEYHKILTMFERDAATNFKKVHEGCWACPEFDVLQHLDWVCTEKVDGTNIRILWDGERVTFAGKTDRTSLPAPLVTRLQELFYAGAFATIFTEGPVCLYGEGYGKGIQRGGNYLPDRVEFMLFDVWAGGLWLTRASVEDIATKFEIPCVPIIYTGPLREAAALVKQGFPSVIAQTTGYRAEGLVCKPCVELQDRRGHRIITKIKHTDF